MTTSHIGSRNAAQSMSGPDFLGGRRGRMKQTQTVRTPRLRNPRILVVQAKPSWMRPSRSADCSSCVAGLQVSRQGALPSYLWHQLPDHYWIYHPARRITRGDNTHGEASVLVEILRATVSHVLVPLSSQSMKIECATHSRHQGESRCEEYTATKPSEKTLRDHELPVFGADAHQEYAQNLNHRPNEECRHEETSVQKTTCKYTANHGQPNLQRPDPRNG